MALAVGTGISAGVRRAPPGTKDAFRPAREGVPEAGSITDEELGARTCHHCPKLSQKPCSGENGQHDTDPGCPRVGGRPSRIHLENSTLQAPAPPARCCTGWDSSRHSTALARPPPSYSLSGTVPPTLHSAQTHISPSPPIPGGKFCPRGLSKSCRKHPGVLGTPHCATTSPTTACSGHCRVKQGPAAACSSWFQCLTAALCPKLGCRSQVPRGTEMPRTPGMCPPCIGQAAQSPLQLQKNKVGTRSNVHPFYY